MTTPRVLVIDDEPQIRKLIRSALEGRGYSVDEAADGREGARRFRERPPDLVIVDIFMPEKEGIETILELRHVDPSIKCIAISGGGLSGSLVYLKHAEYFGALRTFSKPFLLSEMLDAVGELAPAS